MPQAHARPSKSRVLENFMQTLHDLTGLNISFVDMGGFTKLKKFSIDESAYAERCKFCKLVASSKKGVKRCMDNDKKMMEKAVSEAGVVMSRCHAGLVDMVVPILSEGETLGFIFGGQVMDRELSEPTIKDVLRRTGDLGFTEKEIREKLKAVPLISKETLRHAANLVTMVAGYIASTERSLSLFKQVRRSKGDLRLKLVSDLIYGSVKQGGDFDASWKEAFEVKGLPRGLAAVKLRDFQRGIEGLSDSERIQEVEKRRLMLQEGLEKDTALEYVGSGLFCALLTGQPKLQEAEAAAKALRSVAAKAWPKGVLAASGGIEESPSTLYRAFNRAVMALDAEENPHGRQVIAVDEMEDALPRLNKELSEALQFGQREEARAAALKAFHACLSSRQSERARRANLLEVLRAAGSGIPSSLEQRPALNALLYEATELVIQAKAVEAELVGRLMQKLEAMLPLLPEGGRDRQKDVVKRVKAYLDTHLAENASLAKLARDFGLGQYNLSRIFRKETGSTLKNYIARRRVEESAKLLTHSTSSIAEIAEKVGFHDFHYFCLVFKKLTGVPPGAFRKGEQAREKNEAEAGLS